MVMRHAGAQHGERLLWLVPRNRKWRCSDMRRTSSKCATELHAPRRQGAWLKQHDRWLDVHLQRWLERADVHHLQWWSNRLRRSPALHWELDRLVSVCERRGGVCLR